MGRKPYTKEMRDSKRREILDAAEALVLEEGMGSATMRVIGGRVGISSMTLYLYFEGREDVLGHLAARGYKELVKTIGSVKQTGDASARLGTLVNGYLKWGRENARMFELMHSGDVSGHDLVQEGQAQIGGNFAAVVTNLMGASADGEVIAGVKCTLDLLVSVVFRTLGETTAELAESDGLLLRFLRGGLLALKG